MKRCCILPPLLLAALVLRASSFFYSVIDWDESLYMLIARSMLEGNAPYTAIWNNTPPGIYPIFAAILFLFPDSILAIRIVTCIAVGLTGFALCRLGCALDETGPTLGLFAGILYVLHTGSSAMGGLASNTELFYLLFTTWAFLVTFKSERFSTGLLAGLLFGAGFQIKYHAGFDFLAALLIAGGRTLRQAAHRTGWQAACRRCLAMLAGFALPSAGVVLYFLASGHFQAYVDSALLANLVYAAGGGASPAKALTALARQLLAHPLLWLSALFAGLMLTRQRKALREHPNELWIFAWLVIDLLSILATRRFWGHYFLQALPPMCLLAASAARHLQKSARGRLSKALVLAVVLLATSMLGPTRENLNEAAHFVIERSIARTDGWKDTPRLIAEYLDERTGSSDTIYVADYQPVIYFLAEARCPTRYPFPDHLVNPELADMTGVDPVAELHAIMAKSPLYVIRRQEPDREPSPFYALLDRTIHERYVYETSFYDPREEVQVDLYRLNE